MPDETFVLLPDETDPVALPEGTGLTAAPDALLRVAAAAMRPVPPDPADTPEHLPAWRGLLAFALLSDTFSAGQLTVSEIKADASPLAEAALSALGRESLRPVRWEVGDRSEVLGIADKTWGILPARQDPALRDMLPPEVTWLEGTGTFGDPAARLDCARRTLLRRRLLALGSPETKAFADLLAEHENAVLDSALMGSDAEDWRSRITAVACLGDEQDFAPLQLKPETVRQGVNALLTALGKTDPEGALPAAGTWSWRGTPFARLGSRIGLEPLPEAGDAAKEALAELSEEWKLLSRSSRRLMAQAHERLQRWCEEHAGQLDPQARSQTSLWVEAMKQESLLPKELPVFTWPLDDASPALRLLFRDALGEEGAALALHPFSDAVTLVRGGMLGDARLEAACTVEDGEAGRIALPPLSDAVAEHVTRHGWGDGCPDPALTRLRSLSDGGVEVTLTFAGREALQLKRTYTPEEQLRMELPPSLSMWPLTPLPPERWHRYWLSVSGGCTLRLLREGRWAEERIDDTETRVFSLDTFPRAVTLRQGGKTLGILTSLDPQAQQTGSGAMTGALDIGGAGVRLFLQAGGLTEPLSLPSLWRILLRADREYAREPLPVWPLGPVLPAAVSLTGDADDPALFADGHIVPEEQSDSPDAFGNLLWRGDRTGVRARRILIRESLLLLSLAAAQRGADSLQLRLTLPDTMTDAARQALMTELTVLCGAMSRETGLTLTPESAPVPSLAACLAFARQRFPGMPVAVLDIGSGSAGCAVWLRGLERPALSVNLGDGVSAFLAHVFSLRPTWLQEELWLEAGAYDRPAEQRFRRAGELAARASGSPAGFDALRRTLDRLLGPDFADTAAAIGKACAAAMRVSRVQSLLLFTFALRLTQCGLALEKLRWDSALSIHLPPEMPLFMAGQAPLLISTFDSTQQWQLTRFSTLAMSGGHPVMSFPMTWSSAPGTEAAQGAFDVPLPAPEAGITRLEGAVQPVQLTGSFLMAFRQCFPDAADQLFPGFFTFDGYATPFAETTLTAAASRIPARSSDPFRLLTEGILLDLLR